MSAGTERFPVPAAAVGRRIRERAPTVTPADRLALAAAHMRSVRVAALAVLDGGQLVGIVSESDVLRAVADGFSTDVIRVADYMAPPPGPIGVADAPSLAVRKMIEDRVRHLPVLRDGQVVGVVSARDLLVLWGVPPELIGDESQ